MKHHDDHFLLVECHITITGIQNHRTENQYKVDFILVIGSILKILSLVPVLALSTHKKTKTNSFKLHEGKIEANNDKFALGQAGTHEFWKFLGIEELEPSVKRRVFFI